MPTVTIEQTPVDSIYDYLGAMKRFSRLVNSDLQNDHHTGKPWKNIKFSLIRRVWPADGVAHCEYSNAFKFRDAALLLTDLNDLKETVLVDGKPSEDFSALLELISGVNATPTVERTVEWFRNHCAKSDNVQRWRHEMLIAFANARTQGLAQGTLETYLRGLVPGAFPNCDTLAALVIPSGSPKGDLYPLCFRRVAFDGTQAKLLRKSCEIAQQSFAHGISSEHADHELHNAFRSCLDRWLVGNPLEKFKKGYSLLWIPVFEQMMWPNRAGHFLGWVFCAWPKSFVKRTAQDVETIYRRMQPLADEILDLATREVLWHRPIEAQQEWNALLASANLFTPWLVKEASDAPNLRLGPHELDDLAPWGGTANSQRLHIDAVIEPRKREFRSNGAEDPGRILASAARRINSVYRQLALNASLRSAARSAAAAKQGELKSQSLAQSAARLAQLVKTDLQLAINDLNREMGETTHWDSLLLDRYFSRDEHRKTFPLTQHNPTWHDFPSFARWRDAFLASIVFERWETWKSRDTPPDTWWPLAKAIGTAASAFDEGDLTSNGTWTPRVQNFHLRMKEILWRPHDIDKDNVVAEALYFRLFESVHVKSITLREKSASVDYDVSRHDFEKYMVGENVNSWPRLQFKPYDPPATLLGWTTPLCNLVVKNFTLGEGLVVSGIVIVYTIPKTSAHGSRNQCHNVDSVSLTLKRAEGSKEGRDWNGIKAAWGDRGLITKSLGKRFQQLGANVRVNELTSDPMITLTNLYQVPR